MVQAGVWVITAIIWGSVFSNNLILFSAHPVSSRSFPVRPLPIPSLTIDLLQLLNSAAFLFLIQAILILQPTHTAKQKKQGTYAHSSLNSFATLSAIAGLIVIEYNKFAHNGKHFDSAHGRLGLVTYILVAMQALAGATSFYAPALYGGVENAKALYKYHRVGGYFTVLVMLATIASATYTDFNKNVLKIQLWAVVVAAVVLVIGLAARIRLAKFGYLAGK